MLLWGGLWSQLHIALLPFMAGTVSAQICTFLACLAVAFATTSSVTALDRSGVPAPLRWATLTLGIGVGLAGIPLAMMRSRSEEHTSELQTLMRISYAGFWLQKKKIYLEGRNNIFYFTYHVFIHPISATNRIFPTIIHAPAKHTITTKH